MVGLFIANYPYQYFNAVNNDEIFYLSELKEREKSIDLNYNCIGIK